VKYCVKNSRGKKKPLKHGIAMVFKLSDGYFTSIGGILKR
jgi:hypothetical protein